ncbi:MAG: hybrid sensor histidine kinase/response regulator [Campylobacterota bacterium]|nr:hybrid sensor histidine kinase/response regulator [Campylobacterota bacterium]
MLNIKELKKLASNLTVLYVEDELSLQESVSVYLSKIFKTVVCASDGLEGLDIYKKNLDKDEKFDIVVTDIEMPKMDGLKMSAAIKELDNNQEIIILSAYTSTEYFTKSIQIGVGGYVIKPMSNEQLSEVLYKISLRISEHKRLIEYESLLENRVKEEVEKNKINQKMLLEQSKMASMGEMLESIAHQWRQPLSVITTAASGIKMQKEYGLLSDEEFEVAVASIINAAMHLSTTIDDFRDFFKADKPNEMFKVSEAYKRARDLLSSKFKNREIETIENIDDVEIYGMVNEFVQVFMNILNNAKDALEEIENQQRLIFLEIKKDENRIVIKIKDNAGGIKEDIIGKIFDSHFTTKKNKDGTGIGLYMTQQIIQEHLKGKLEVRNESYTYENTKYNGALFEITIPLSSIKYKTK